MRDRYAGEGGVEGYNFLKGDWDERISIYVLKRVFCYQSVDKETRFI